MKSCHLFLPENKKTSAGNSFASPDSKLKNGKTTLKRVVNQFSAIQTAPKQYQPASTINIPGNFHKAFLRK